MNPADLDRHSARQAQQSATAMRAAERRVDRAVRDAYGHAVKALTEALKATEPGRPSIRKARSSPSYKAALADLDALLSALCGTSTNATAGTLRDAREASYRSSLAWWDKVLPPEMAVADPAPTPDRIAAVRGLVLHGMDLRAEIGARVTQVGASLLATLERATKPGVLSADAIDLIDGWAAQSRTTLNQAIQLAIGDAATAIEGYATNDAIRPELRANDEFAPPQE